MKKILKIMTRGVFLLPAVGALFGGSISKDSGVNTFFNPEVAHADVPYSVGYYQSYYQPYYQPYYQSYYQDYYQGYYQGYYQDYYQDYYQSYYEGVYFDPSTGTPDCPGPDGPGPGPDCC